MICGKAFVGGNDYVSKHLSANDYYEKGKQVTGIWLGKACESFGIEENTAVSPEAFEAIRDNKHALSGAQLTVRHNTSRKNGIEKVSNRRNFYDFTFSAPKSFSIMAVTMEDSRIREWHHNAVMKTIAEMEKYTARQEHISCGIEQTSKFCAAMYAHDANRALEPQLHNHVIIFNATPSAGGRNYAIESNEFFQRCRYLTAVYRNELANQAINGGYDIEFDKHNAPQVKGLKEISEHFSQRTKEIEILIEQAEDYLGTTLGRAEKKQITFASRGFDLEKFEELWNNQKAKISSRKEFMQQFLNTVRNASNSSLHETTTPQVINDQWNGLSEEQQSTLNSVLNETAHKVEFNRKGKAHNLYQNLEEATFYAKEHHFERQSVIKDYTFKETVLNSVCGQGYELQNIESQLQKQLDDNKIIAVQNELAAVEHWEREKKLLSNIERGRNVFGKDIFSEFDLSAKLNLEQSKAVKQLLKSPDQFYALVGKAGTGKTFSISEIVRANIENDIDVVMCAPTNGARDVLRKDGRILEEKYGQTRTAQPFEDAISLQRLLLDEQKKIDIKPGSLIVLDEAGLASTKQLYSLAKLVKQSRARLLLVGDSGQHSSVEAGDAFRMLLKYSSIERTKIKQVMRQNKDAMKGVYRQVAKDLSNGNIRSAFCRLEEQGAIIEAKGKTRHEMMAEEYMKAVDAGHLAIIVNPTHRENNDVSAKTREKLKARDLIHNEREMLTFKSLNWTAAQKKTYKSYQPGMILDYRNNQQENFLTVQKIIHNKGLLCQDNSGNELIIARNALGNYDVFEKQSLQIGIGDRIMLKSGGKNKTGEFSNGEIITVKDFDKSGNIISSDGRILTTSKFSYGYASTSHKSQGTTCHSVIIGFDRHSIQHADRKIAYVAGTRGTEEIKIFCENKLELWDIEKRKGDRQSVIEMLEKDNPQEQKSQTRIHSIMNSLHNFYERIQEKLLKITIQTKEPEMDIKMEYHKESEIEYHQEMKTEHNQESKREMEQQQEFGMSM
jgi:conjugative relaxase-like TrwC/TraI family protein